MILLVDTSVFLNILNVPGFNQNRDSVLDDFNLHIGNSVTLLLPLAACIETGNHIAHLSDGGERRRHAATFVTQMKMALKGDAPWRPTPLPDARTMAVWLDSFPDHAMRGVGLGDLWIIKEWKVTCRRHPRARVAIWSLDADLRGYDRNP